MRNNKDKNTPVDESILDVTPPNINTPQAPDDEDPDNVDPNPDPKVPEGKKNDEPDETVPDEQDEEGEALPKDTKKEEVPDTATPETPEQKEQRYKAQQTEAQILAARNRGLLDKVDEAAKIPEPTEEELKAFVGAEGHDWETLTAFEKSMAKKTYIADRRFSLVNEAVQVTRKVDEWAGKVDTFLDKADGDPKYLDLSGHEADFRKFAMKEAHRGAAIESLLLPAFLQTLPKPTKKRNSLFDTAGGGEKEQVTGKITDADTLANLRATNPREYRRQVKMGNVKLEL